ncbi:MAG TPA: histidine kinase [Actinomycetota bacterium]|nr:histidine kinase [Actinomycetota bacterium]
MSLEVSSQREPGGARLLSYLLAGLIAAVWVLGGVLLTINQPLTSANDWSLWGLFMVTGFTYIVAALAIVRRRPGNAIGWLFFFISGVLGASIAMTEYGIYAITKSPGSLPAPGIVLVFAEPTPVLTLSGIILMLLLFPTGRPVSRRWRPVVWLTVASIVLSVVGHAVIPHRVVDAWSDMLSHTHTSAANPWGIAALARAKAPATTLVALMVWATGFLAVVSLFVRRRRADAVERTQLRWLAYVVGIAAGWIAVMLPIAIVVGSNGWAGTLFWQVITPLVALGIPISVGIAIVRYRLFDIDVVISKTIVYGTLAVFITIVYVAIVVGIGQVAGSVSTPALSAIAAAVVAIAFQPVRRRVQRVANRFVYGNRATPYEVLSDFSDRVAEAYSTDDVLPRMAEIVASGTGVSRAEVWLRVGSEFVPRASWPDAKGAGNDHGPEPARPLRVTGHELPEFGDGRASFPVRHQGDLLGAIVVEASAADPLTPAKEKLIMDLAAQAGLVLRNARLLEELRASRQRIVTAQDERARALERNIHDGAQQQLVALAIKLKLASSMAERDPAKTGEMLSGLQQDATDALENLRDLARGIYPPLLADKGLPAALQAQIRKATLPISLDADGIGRYPQEVEAAVYFCALEALQNVSKYANAGRARVRLAASNGDLTFAVEDDGAGFDPGSTGYGTGLQGMADRLEALGGDLAVRSSPGTGTQVEGRVPVPPEPAR